MIQYIAPTVATQLTPSTPWEALRSPNRPPNPNIKELLRKGSAIGKKIDQALLKFLFKQDIPPAYIKGLISDGLIIGESENTCAFASDEIYEVTKALYLSSDLMQVHREIGQYFEEKFNKRSSEEFFDRATHHYSLSDEFYKACEFLTGRARRYLDLMDFELAANDYKRINELLAENKFSKWTDEQKEKYFALNQINIISCQKQRGYRHVSNVS